MSGTNGNGNVKRCGCPRCRAHDAGFVGRGFHGFTPQEFTDFFGVVEPTREPEPELPDALAAAIEEATAAYDSALAVFEEAHRAWGEAESAARAIEGGNGNMRQWGHQRDALDDTVDPRAAHKAARGRAEAAWKLRERAEEDLAEPRRRRNDAAARAARWRGAKRIEEARAQRDAAAVEEEQSVRDKLRKVLRR